MKESKTLKTKGATRQDLPQRLGPLRSYEALGPMGCYLAAFLTGLGLQGEAHGFSSTIFLESRESIEIERVRRGERRENREGRENRESRENSERRERREERERNESRERREKGEEKGEKRGKAE